MKNQIIGQKQIIKNQKDLPDGKLNPGIPRDRRGYSPLYYRGLHAVFTLTTVLILDSEINAC